MANAAGTRDSSPLKLSRPWVVAAAAFIAALVVYAVQSLAWPMTGGRDAGSYLQYYLGLWEADSVHPELMLFRTPVAPLLVGPLLQLGGPAALEAGFALLFAASVAALAAAAVTIGLGLAAATVAVVLLYPSNGALFHQFSSDPVTALGAALLALAAVRAARQPSLARFALLGALVALLALARPVNQVLLLLVVLPLVTTPRWRERLLGAGAFAAAAVALLAGWAAHNNLRYEDFTVARSGAAQLPLARAFVADRIVSPENGDASLELARHVRRHLLAEEPYRSYGVTEDDFFASGSWRMFYDLLYVSNQAWGWHSDYTKLRPVGLEAVRANPRLYAEGVGRTVWDELVLPYELPASSRPAAEPGPAPPPETIVVAGRRLPRPTEGEPIPGQRLHWLLATPDDRIWTDWSDVASPAIRYRDPEQEAAAERLERRLRDWQRRLPNRDGSRSLASFLNGANGKLPPMLVWLLLGLPSLLLWRRPEVRALTLVAAASLLVVVVTALGVPTALEFALPFQPVFILCGLTGLLAIAQPVRARRGHLEEHWERSGQDVEGDRRRPRRRS